jgi:hypothetical protein
LGGEVVAEVVLLLAGQKMARVDAKGVVALAELSQLGVA